MKLEFCTLHCKQRHHWNLCQWYRFNLNIDSYHIVTKALEDKNTEFHTFRPKQERTYNIVLKGIHGSTSLDKIKE